MYVGLRAVGSTINKKFTTVNASGAPTTLVGTPELSVLRGSNPADVSQGGLTLSVDHASITGLNDAEIDTSADLSFYLAGFDYDVFISTGTVGGVSVIGYPVASFSLDHNPRGIIARGTAQAGGGDNEIVLDPADTAPDTFYNGMVVFIGGGTGAGQLRVLLDNINASKVATVEPNWVINPDATSEYLILGVPPSVGLEAAVNQALEDYDAPDLSAVQQVTTDLSALINALNNFDPTTQQVLANLTQIQGQNLNANKPFDVP